MCSGTIVPARVTYRKGRRRSGSEKGYPSNSARMSQATRRFVRFGSLGHTALGRRWTLYWRWRALETVWSVRDANSAAAVSGTPAVLGENRRCWRGSDMLRRTGGGGNDAKLAFRGYEVCREGRARWELDAECRDRGKFQEDGGTML